MNSVVHSTGRTQSNKSTTTFNKWWISYIPSTHLPGIQRSLLAIFASHRTYVASSHRRLRSASDSRSLETKCSAEITQRWSHTRQRQQTGNDTEINLDNLP